MPMVTLQPPVAKEVDRMRRRLSRLFDDPFAFTLATPSAEGRREAQQWWAPTVEASETPTEYVLTAELPGISPEDVELQIAEATLTMRGSKKDERKVEDKERRYHVWEREYGSFERSFHFPSDIDSAKVEAMFSNGVLTVKVPKLTTRSAEVRTVPITKK